MTEPREVVLNDPNSVCQYIRELLNAFLDFESACMENGITIAKDIREQAEQFIKENEQ